MTLAEFLLARIGEDVEDLENARIGDSPEWWMPSMWSRERAEAECEAKRRIVKIHQGSASQLGMTSFSCLTCGWAGEYDEPWPCETIQALALPYADHPDYQQEWAPETQTVT